MSAMVMRGLIAVFLLVLAGLQLQQGNTLNAAVDLIFALVAGLLAFSARPGARRPPNAVLAGLVAVGIVLWIVSLVGRFW